MIICNFCGRRIKTGDEVIAKPFLDIVGVFFMGQTRTGPVTLAEEPIHLHADCQKRVTEEMTQKWRYIMRMDDSVKLRMVEDDES